jgi:hypothetical protein
VAVIAKSTVHEIISDLNFHKVSACWVPKMLTEEHKSKRTGASFENLCRYQDEGELYIESIVTGDETWVFKFNPESKRNTIAKISCAILHITWKGTLS